MPRYFFKKSVVLIFIFLWFLSAWPMVWQVNAAVTVTQALGGAAISADTTGGTYTALTNPIITEFAVGEVGTGTVILNVPSGFIFDTATNVTLTVTSNFCSGKSGNVPVKLGTSGQGSATQTVTPTTTTITHTVRAASAGSNCESILTYTNIRVRPTAGTPLGYGNLSKSGTSVINGVDGNVNFGTLAEVAGAKNKLAVTTQPSSTANANSDFTAKPVVTLQDQFGNRKTSDNSSTVTAAVVLSTQSCGGTAGSGSLTSTPSSGAAVTAGLMTYTAMQYSAAESIKICFSSTGVTSALSSAITVSNPVSLPTVTTQAASSVKDTTATGNGNITATGGENADKRGFVYDTVSRSAPGNVAPASSGYAGYAEDSGSFGTGAFTKGLTGLTSGATHYARAYAHNSAGYSYGGEVSFATAVISVSITSSGVISYGFVAPGASANTVASGTQTARNDSTIAENFNIKTSNATGGTQWTIGSASGINIFVHEFSVNGGGAWTKFTGADTYQTLATGVAASGTQNFDLRITAPTDSDTQQKTINITVQAVAQ